MTYEHRYMTVTEARDFLKATPARKSEYALHLSAPTYTPDSHDMRESRVYTYLDLTRTQALAILERTARDRVYAPQTIAIGVKLQDNGKTLYWLG